MTEIEELRLIASLSRLQADYWYEVDRNWGRRAAEYYLEDGVFEIGESRMEGRAAIAHFYSWREGRGERTARHLVTNCRLRSVNATGDEAVFECIMSLHAADGPPVLESRPPIMIADVVDHCVRVSGVWRYRSHVLRPVFMGGVAPTVLPGNDQTTR
ncbi:nuclear transport factor 2 family protein [Roseomonas marmotae]|uniref:Nuclear transport factor 2 family protein n=1 Tax=Roseomonas marmotae TaxID=2768161 RepID=A0ABS3K7P2_9PROT|nr:nuclear transport factor 2 family protein [Roseomonas marmotae]MBO1073499.1 nuclear transport factor 2 family protein [Roseomonas marmotae]QTI80312.1 nuclear transport factor 2 family protein [Roseomonas marmotae]